MAFISKTTILTAAFMLAWVSCSAMPGAAELPTNAMGAPEAIRTAMEPKFASAGPECTAPGLGKDCPHANDRFVTSSAKPPEQVALPEPPAMKVVPGLEEPLVAMGYVSGAESKDLDAAITAFREAPKNAAPDADFSDYAKPLIAYMDAHPTSAWNVAILTNLGLGYYHAGYFSKAFTNWQAAWDQGRNATATPARLLVDRAVGELVRMHARVGHEKELETLFTDIGNRPIGGSATEMVQGAREGLWDFKNKPGLSYLCGPSALSNVLKELKGKPEQISVADNARSGPHGFSLTQLADKAGVKYTLIHREPGQPVPVPSVINWNVHHYAAVLSAQGGFYTVDDPTFGNVSSAALTEKAIDAESSGYFLVPAQTMAQTSKNPWRVVHADSAEAKEVYGMGTPTDFQGESTTPGDPKICPCGPGGNASDGSGNVANAGNGSVGTAGSNGIAPGLAAAGKSGSVVGNPVAMTVASAHPVVVSLNLADTPVGYQPQKGGSVRTTVTYNSREAMLPANFSFSNFGQKWSSSWEAYLIDDPGTNREGYSLQRIAGGGGGYTYNGAPTNYSRTTGQVLIPEVMDFSFLWRVPATGALTRYERRFSDGSKEIYSLPDGAATYPRKVFLTSVVDAIGNTTTLNYDGTFRITSITDAMTRSTTFTYGLGSYPLLVTQITDPFSRSASFTYDATQRLASITDAVGITSTFTYLPGEPSFINTMTTPYGTSKYSDRINLYDPYLAVSRSLVMTDPLGYSKYLYAYPSPTIVPATDPIVPTGMTATDNGEMEERNTFYWDQHAYANAITTDACNNPLVEDFSKATILHWLKAGNAPIVIGRQLSSSKRPLENRVWYNYQSQTSFLGTDSHPIYVGRVLDDSSTQKAVSTYLISSTFLPTLVTDPMGRATQYNYDTNNLDLLTVKQETNSSPLTYTTIGTYGSYTAAHQPQTYIGADGKTWAYTYTAAGQIKTITDPNTGVTTWNYDASNRLINVVNANTVTVLTLTYDAYDRVRTRTDSQGYVLTYDYDNLDRVIKITYPDATTDLFDYTFQSGPSTGNPTLDLRKFTDRLGRITTYNYDADERLTSVVEPLTGATTRTTSYDYYENGKLKNITDANSNVTHWEIDIQSRPTSKTYAYGTASAKTEIYTYENTTSRLKSITDALGQVKTFAYNKDDTIASVTYTSSVNTTPNVTFAYDTYFPRVSSMADGTGTTNYSYTAIGTNGALALSSIVGPYTNDSLGLTYDNMGRPSGDTISGGNESFGYDAISRMNSHVTPLGTFTNTFLGQTGQITGRSVTNGGVTVSTAWGYDTNTNDRRLISITNSGVTRSFTLGYGTTPVNPYDIMSITDTAAATHPWATQSHAYTYDYSDRLLTASYTTPGNFTYAYDALDNPTTWTTPGGTTNPTYNALNQIATWGMLNYAYDSDGNLSNGDGVKTYKWDAENRLIEIDYVGSSAKSQFTYNGIGERRIDVETASGGGVTTTRYMWCGAYVCQIRDGSDTVLRRHMAEGEYNVSSGQKLVYMPDQVFAIRDVLDATTGNLIQSYDYAPYGAVTRSTGSAGTDYQYALMFNHSASGLSLSATRPFDGATGRWLGKDPIREAGGVNIYGYAGANPINSIDPLGLDVSICHRPADLPFPMNQADHYWIKTDKQEAGMGGECPTPGQQCSDAPYSSTHTISHAGQSKAPNSTCEKQQNVDEACVDSKIAPGQPTGTWNTANQCQSFTYSTINSCRYGPQIGPVLPPDTLKKAGPMGSHYGPAPPGAAPKQM
jgi:RHS repeat-associated protein